MESATPATPATPASPPPRLTREVLALAIPALATLVAEPLMIMVDAAIIGHVSTTALAGLGVAASVLTIPISLCVFLAYGATSMVARQLGAGHQDRALQTGVDGLTLGAILGVVLAVLISATASLTTSWYGPAPEVHAEATAYLRITAIGMIGLLIMLAATGVLRGLQDTTTPLWVVLGANLLNVVLTVTLVRGFHWGIEGAAIGTAIAQLAAGATMAGLVVRRVRRAGVKLRPRLRGVVSAMQYGGWLVLRGVSLQSATATTAMVATRLGTVAIATHQITNALWALLAMALDAIAIAAQAIVGRYLGAGHIDTVRILVRRLLWWGAIAGVIFAVVVILTRPLYAFLMTPDPQVQELLVAVLVVVACCTPLNAAVFVLDGVLIGASDAKYLALAGLLTAVVFIPLALLVYVFELGLVWLWLSYGIFMLARLVVLALRVRGTAWLKVGDDLSNR